MQIIKIDREEKLDVVVNGRVFIVDALYHVISGEDRNHAYILKKIYKVGRDWMLRLGDRDYDAEIRCADLEASYPDNFRKCECNFLCEGYVLKNFLWI
jgi:hypothetical protein